VTAPNKYAAQGSLDAMVAGPLPAVRVNVADITLPPVSLHAYSSELFMTYRGTAAPR
jgi:hypothetical protein